jgi:hypothetical protein
MTNTIGYVSTQKNQSREEMNTDLDLNSSVELYFKTDYVPLDRLAGQGQVDRIKVNTLNPDAEAKEARQARETRVSEARKAESAASSQVNDSLRPRAPAPPPAAEPPPKTPAPKPESSPPVAQKAPAAAADKPPSAPVKAK